MLGLSALLSSSKPEYAAIFDVSSDSVGIALVKTVSAKDSPRVLFSHRVKMRIQSSAPNSADRLKQMRETLFSASLIFSKDALQTLANHDRRGRVTKIFLVASAPWAYTLSREVSYEGEDEFSITQEIITDLASSAEKSLENPTPDEAIFVENGFTVVENTTVDIRVNGYSVENPLCLKGKTLSLSHITGFMHRDILESVMEVRDKILTDTDIDAHTGMLVSYCVLRDFFPETKDLVVASVTGESTEVGIIESGVLLETHSIHYGAHTLIRDIVDKTGQTTEHVLSMLRGYAELTLTDTARNSVETHVNMYTMKLAELFSAIVNRRALPKTIIILTDQDIEAFVRAEILKTIERITSEHHTVLHVDGELLEHFDSHDEADVRLALASRFFHKICCINEAVDN